MNPVKGIALKLCSVVMFITMASLIKAASEHVPPGQAVFFRSLFALPVIIAWLTLRGDLKTGLKVKSKMAHFWRGLVGTSAMGMGFAGLGLLPLPEVTAIGYAAPLLTVVFAAMFLGEEVRLFRMFAVGLGLLGVLIVIEPRFDPIAGRNRANGAGPGGGFDPDGGHFCGAGADPHPQYGPERGNLSNCVLLLPHRDGPVPADIAVWLGGADGA